MTTLHGKIESAIRYLSEKHYAEFANEYGEPGYSNPERGIILANWNNVPKGLADWLEKLGYDLEWSDEWTIDYNHGCKAYRTAPSGYDWQSSVMVTDDGELLTPDDDAGEWINECAMTDKGQPCRVLPDRITPADLEHAGFRLFEGDKESGFFPGQTDNPKEAAQRAFAAGALRVVFRKTEQSQFYIKWEAYAEWEESEDSDER